MTATTGSGTRAGRNDICPCGSGKKFKKCCGAVDTAVEDTASRFFGVAAVAAGLMLVGGLFVWAKALFFDAPSSTKVWSAEHGHYHDASGAEPSAGGAGKVWSEEHGHYHDASGGELAAGGAGAGKVWNEEHGHFHDAVQAPPPPVAPATPVPGALDNLRAAELEAAREKVAPPVAAD